jgi:hypothetical protein
MLAPIWVISRLSREHGGHVGEAPQRLSAGLLNLLPSIRRLAERHLPVSPAPGRLRCIAFRCPS